MRWPSFITRSNPGEPTRRRVPQGVIGREAGDRGTEWWEAADREINPDLAGRARYRLYDHMVSSDPVVAGALLGVLLPIAAADWRITPASENPVDRLVADAAGEQLGLTLRGADRWMVEGFDDLLWSLGLSLRYGSMTMEVEWNRDVLAWSDADDDVHGLLAIRRLAPRYPHTLHDYVAGDSISAPLASVRQDGVKNPIDGERLVHIAHGRELGRFVGSPMIRPAYGSWKFKRELMVAANIGYGRHMAGLPVISYPESDGDEGKAKAAAIGRGHRTHELAYVALPAREPTQPQWGFRVEGGAHTLADPIPLLRHHDEQIVSATLERFLMLGSTETGSRAVGEVLAEPFYLALNWLASRFADALNEQVLRRWVTVNFGAEVDCPTVVCPTIQQRNLPVRGRFLAEAAAGGVDFSDREAQNVIRSWADIPELPEGFVPEGTSPL